MKKWRAPHLLRPLYELVRAARHLALVLQHSICAPHVLPHALQLSLQAPALLLEQLCALPLVRLAPRARAQLGFTHGCVALWHRKARE